MMRLYQITSLNKFRHVWTCSDMFENRNNSYHIESKQVKTCLRIVTIRIILNLNKFRHVWEFNSFESCFEQNQDLCHDVRRLWESSTITSKMMTLHQKIKGKLFTKGARGGTLVSFKYLYKQRFCITFEFFLDISMQSGNHC